MARLVPARFWRFIALSILPAVMAAADFIDDQATLVFEPERVEFENVELDSNPKKVVRIHNKGQAAIALSRVESTCHCTSAKLSPQALPPGGVAEISVGLNLEGYASDEIFSRILVFQEGNDDPIAHVEVGGNIVPEYVIEPDEIDFRKVKKQASAQLDVVVEQNWKEPFKLLAVEAPPAITAEIEELAQEDEVNKAPRVYVVHLTLKPQDREMAFRKHLVFKTDVKRKPNVKVPVRAQIVGIQATFTPPLIMLEGKIGNSAEAVIKADEPLDGVKVVLLPDWLILQSRQDGNGQWVVRTTVKKVPPIDTKITSCRLQIKQGNLVETRELPIRVRIESR